MPESLKVFFMGDVSFHEFEAARAWLEQQCGAEVFADEPFFAVERIAEQQPHWVVLAQSRPGRFSQQLVDEIRQAAPLAVIIGLLGSLCEGEMRTGEPLRGVVRVYWHQWKERAAQQAASFQAGTPSVWSPQGEATVFTFREPRPTFTGLVVIAANDFATYDSFAAEFQQEGFATLWRHPHDRPVLFGVQAAIWVGAGASPEEMSQLKRFADEMAPAKVTALLNFPRSTDIRAARQAGASRVLAKPVRNAELLAGVSDAADF